MKFFLKISLAVFFSLVLVISSISFITLNKNITTLKDVLVDEYYSLGTQISKNIEVGIPENQWPFESLNELSKRKDFKFWWIVKKDGTIYLADDNSFIETNAYDYFPKFIEEENIKINEKENYGVFIDPIETSNGTLYFWLGFSLDKINNAKKESITFMIYSTFISLIILGLIIYLIIFYFTKPIKKLTKCADRIKKGNLNKKCRIKTKDELEDLAQSFDEMRLAIKDRNDLLESLLKSFKGKFGNIATILARKNIEKLVKKNPRTEKILPKSLKKTIKRSKKLKKSKSKDEDIKGTLSFFKEEDDKNE